MNDERNYIGCKAITAWPQERDGRAGYGVRYPDGYKSWSPKDTFEAAYLPVVDLSHIDEQVVDDFVVDYADQQRGSTTIVSARLRNGFVIVESSGSVDPQRYDHKLGVEICKSRIQSKVWHLLGFALAWAMNGVK